MIPQIFDGETPTTPFNAVTIKLQGSLKSDLKWEGQKVKAQEAIAKGYKIFWEMELGLFAQLSLPFDDETQGKSLKLALDVFYQDVWEVFNEDSIGLCLYRGSADFSRDFPVVERKELLFCTDSCLDYLKFICQDLPDSLPLYLMLDATAIEDPGVLAQLLSRERFENFHCLIHGGAIPLADLAWEDERASYGYIAKRPIPLHPVELANIALCLPPIANETFYKSLGDAIAILNQRGLHYRLIPESHLTMEWEGLDFLLFEPVGLSDLGERKLQGFAAAGGTVVTLGRKIGMPAELTFEEWTEKLLEIL